MTLRYNSEQFLRFFCQVISQQIANSKDETHLHFYKPAGSSPHTLATLLVLQQLSYALVANFRVHFRGRIHLIISKATDLCQSSFSGALDTGNTVVKQTVHIKFTFEQTVCLCFFRLDTKLGRAYAFFQLEIDACTISSFLQHVS